MVLLLSQILPGQTTTTPDQKVTIEKVPHEVKVTVKNCQKQLPPPHPLALNLTTPAAHSHQTNLTLTPTQTTLLLVDHLAPLLIVQSQLY